jgi:hypothetical protein
MEMPAIYCAYKGGELRSAPVKFEGTNISFLTEPARTAYSSEGSDERTEVLLVDVKGLRRREMDDRTFTDIRFPGSDIWLLTHIRDVEDVFDCFMRGIMKLLVPFHTIKDYEVMADIFDMSDNCIPVLFVRDRNVIMRGGRTKDLRTAIADMYQMGFREIAVLDTDSSVGKDEWTALSERYEGIIPFVRNGDAAADGIGFRKMIVDL